MRLTIESEKFFDRRIIRFLGTGVLNTFFGYAVYAALLFIHVPYLAALLLATLAGIVFNYFSFGRMVFQHLGNRLVFLKFVVAYALIYCVNAVLLKALTHSFPLNLYIGQLICIPVSVVLSWMLMSGWVYKRI